LLYNTLSELELDALAELVNIGVSHAASSLREMVGQQVLLSVPKVELLNRAHALEVLCEREDSRLVAVVQAFEGDITGRVLLIFPDHSSLELVRTVIGGQLSSDDIVELEQEALAEIGNIILNACLATIANLLKRSLKMSLPSILTADSNNLFEAALPSQTGDFVIFLYINFTVRERNISGYIAMLMDVSSFSPLKVLLGEFIDHSTK